jgi:DNA repair exonuclease SbcCD ATPase subunit
MCLLQEQSLLFRKDKRCASARAAAKLAGQFKEHRQCLFNWLQYPESSPKWVHVSRRQGPSSANHPFIRQAPTPNLDQTQGTSAIITRSVFEYQWTFLNRSNDSSSFKNLDIAIIEARTTLLDVKSQLKEALKREASLLEREKEREREKTVEKEATAAATKREKEVKDITIKGLEKRLAEEERQHNLAVKNADASRHARNETQDALEVTQADNNRLAQELKIMTANHENVTIDLEDSRASLERAQADAADQIKGRAELVDAQSAGDIEDVKTKLENLGKVAQDRLDDRHKMEIQLGEARIEAREWKQKGEEYRKNLNVAVGNLLKSEMQLKELKRDNKEIKREGNGEGQAEGSRGGREIIDMTGA